MDDIRSIRSSSPFGERGRIGGAHWESQTYKAGGDDLSSLVFKEETLIKKKKNIREGDKSRRTRRDRWKGRSST